MIETILIPIGFIIFFGILFDRIFDKNNIRKSLVGLVGILYVLICNLLLSNCAPPQTLPYPELLILDMDFPVDGGLGFGYKGSYETKEILIKADNFGKGVHGVEVTESELLLRQVPENILIAADTDDNKEIMPSEATVYLRKKIKEHIKKKDITK